MMRAEMSASSLFFPMRKLSCFFALSFCVAAQSRRGCNGPPELEHQTLGKAPAGAYNALGAWFAKRQLNSCAISSFESALRADANSWEARYNLGLALLQSGKLQRAAEELNKLVKQKPDLAQGHLALGVALQDLGDLQGSEAQLHEALALEPKSAGALHQLGETLSLEKRYTAAITYLRQAVELEPQDLSHQLALSEALYENGSANEAIQLLSKTVAAQPRSGLAEFNLATLFAARNGTRKRLITFKGRSCSIRRMTQHACRLQKR